MVVVDSSAIIHLLRIGRLGLLKSLFGKIKITKEIVRELTQENKIGIEEIKKGLSIWIDVKEIKTKKRPSFEGLERGDIEVILLAEKEKDFILSNDLAQIQMARSMGIDCWWVTTLLLQAVKRKIVTKKEAKNILFDLVRSGMRLRIEVYASIEKEIEHL